MAEESEQLLHHTLGTAKREHERSAERAEDNYSYQCVVRGRGGVVVRPLSFTRRSDHSPLTQAYRARFPPRLSHVGIVPDNAAGRRVLSGISHLPCPCIPAPLHTQLTPPLSALKTSLLRAAWTHKPKEMDWRLCQNIMGVVWKRTLTAKGMGRSIAGFGDHHVVTNTAILDTDYHDLDPITLNNLENKKSEKKRCKEAEVIRDDVSFTAAVVKLSISADLPTAYNIRPLEIRGHVEQVEQLKIDRRIGIAVLIAAMIVFAVMIAVLIVFVVLIAVLIGVLIVIAVLSAGSDHASPLVDAQHGLCTEQCSTTTGHHHPSQLVVVASDIGDNKLALMQVHGSMIVHAVELEHRVPIQSLALKAMVHLMRVAMSSLLLTRLSASNTGEVGGGGKLEAGGSRVYTIENLRFRGRSGGVVRLLASHLCEHGSIPNRVIPGFSHVGIVPDDVVGRRVFSEISHSPPPGHSLRRCSLLISTTLVALKTSLLSAAQISSLARTVIRTGDEGNIDSDERERDEMREIQRTNEKKKKRDDGRNNVRGKSERDGMREREREREIKERKMECETREKEGLQSRRLGQQPTRVEYKYFRRSGLFKIEEHSHAAETKKCPKIYIYRKEQAKEEEEEEEEESKTQINVNIGFGCVGGHGRLFGVNTSTLTRSDALMYILHFPAPLHSIIWGFMGITGLLLRRYFQPRIMSVLLRKVLISDPVDDACVRLLQEHGIEATCKYRLPKEELAKEIKIQTRQLMGSKNVKIDFPPATAACNNDVTCSPRFVVCIY
ncbi:hypothetical protein PR048_022905 [Dryococelus australis]|uniref:Uncharacterized protein n=1 Tax=Dryococelus australis TaxID=614101 RepID=A0ABQ9GSL3_9NEOP|nr:hypothetical protein PR048_022905 [Dryococelus australis]